jgi:predicted ferric reductase
LVGWLTLFLCVPKKKRWTDAFAGEDKDEHEQKLEHVYNIMNIGVCLARGAAAGIKLNAALLMIAVLRNFLSWLRGTFVGNYLPIDKNIVFHRNLAWATAFWSAVHTVAHLFNFYHVSTHEDEEDLKAINQNLNTPLQHYAYATLPGWTGHIIVVIMVLMYSSAVKFVRSPMFNVFWYTHHLFVPWFFFGMIHGALGLLEFPTFWLWTIGPLLLYFIERGIRVIRGNAVTILQLAVAHPSNVIELQLKKTGFTYKSGQWFFLNCPFIGKQEWHPFTISSSPGDDYLGCHIRVVGDWTGDLMQFLNPDSQLGVVQENLLSAPDGSPLFKVDGPYGAASEEVFDYKIVVLVGAGIGVTPFASILKDLKHKLEGGADHGLLKVFFFWVARDKNAFEWFGEIINSLEKSSVASFVEFHIYLTAALNVDQIKDVMYDDNDAQDAITGLQSHTNFGRPNWENIFADLAEKFTGEEIGVFLCGPQVLSKNLYGLSKKFTSSRTGTKFVFHKENF